MQKRFLYLLFILCWLVPMSAVSNQPVAYSKTVQKETVVYITKTGEKYHRDGCRYLSRSKIKINKSDAVKNGYGACKVCKP